MHVHVLDEGELLPRGIWKTPYLVDGFPYLIAIDSTGNRVRDQVLRDGMNEERAARTLAIALDAVDRPKPSPRSRLTLVRPEPDPVTSPSIEIMLCLAKYGYYRRMG